MNSYGTATGEHPVMREPDKPELRVTTTGDLVLLIPPTYDGGDPAVEAILKYTEMHMDPDTALINAIRKCN